MPTTGVSFVNTIDVNSTQLKDVLLAARPKLTDEGKFALLQRYTRYPTTNILWGKENVKFGSGTRVEWRVMVSQSGTARVTRPNTPKTVSITDSLQKGYNNWVLMTDEYSIIRDEIEMDRRESKIIDLVTLRRAEAYMNIADLLERLSWTYPSSDSDIDALAGIPHWLVPITASQASAGFQGVVNANESGESLVGGINPTTYTRWKNYNARWEDSGASFTDADIVTLSTMFHKINFSTPAIAKGVDSPAMGKMRLYTNLTVVTNNEKRARKNNDNLGWDTVAGQDSATIVRLPLIYVPYLDADTTHSLYAINHNYLYPYAMEGCWMREGEPMNSRDLPNTFTTNIDLKGNIACTDRQKCGGVVSYVAYTG